MSDAKMQPSTNPITELKATAHLMTMEEGLFCVFNTPGSAPPDAATGLPGVRITAAPGQGGAGGVAISGFNGEGWLGGEAGAALIRVSGGPAQVLVTIYQAADGAHDAPKLQVIRLSDQPAPEAAAAPEEAPHAVQSDVAQPGAAQPDAAQPIEVAAHIYGRGDVGGRLGDWMGEPGSKRWIEGFGLAPGGGIGSGDIEYQAVLGRGWLSPWAEGGQFCGSRGMSLPILGLRVRLRGEAAAANTVSVSATFVDGTQIGPVTDGGAVEAPSLSPLEAFQVTLQPVPAPARARPAVTPARKPARAAAPPAPAPAPAKAVQATNPRRAKAAAPPAPVAPARKPGRAEAAAAPQPPTSPVAAVSVKAGRTKAQAAAEPAPPVATPPSKPAGKAPAKRTPATTRRR